MSEEIDPDFFDWEGMIDTIMDFVPVKMTPRECRELRANIDTSLFASIRDLFDRSSIEFRKSRGEGSEIRLWMSVGQDCVDFQRGFETSAIVAEAYNREDLERARDILTARIEEMQRERAA